MSTNTRVLRALTLVGVIVFAGLLPSEADGQTLTLTPDPLHVRTGGTATMTVNLIDAAPEGDRIVVLSVAGSVASAPAQVVVPPDLSSAGFEVTGIVAGTAELTASWSSLMNSATIIVEDAPPPPPPQSGPRSAPMVRVNAAFGNYCIDRYEASLTPSLQAVSLPGVYPKVSISGADAQAACAAVGKRLCTDTEWVRACRGPANLTYPYGNVAQPGTCNDTGALTVAGGSPACLSAEGPIDMVGNVGEWTADPSGTFRGGYFLDVTMNGLGCGYVTTAHNFLHTDETTGFRCCADECRTSPVQSDYTDDLKSDVLWHHATLGEVWVWLMNGTTRVSETWVATVWDVGYRVIK